MSLVKRGQTSTRINSASGIQSHTTVGGDATGGLLWGNLGNLGALGSESCRTAALREYAQHHGLQPQGQGWRKRKRAHRLHTEIVFLPQSSCKRVRRLAEKERHQDAAEHRVIWNSIPPDPVCAIQENKPRSETENWGREEITTKEDLMHSDSWETLVAWQQYWLGWPVSKKRLCDMNFRNGLKIESYVADTLHWKNWLLKWREKPPIHPHPTTSYLLPVPVYLI